MALHGRGPGTSGFSEGHYGQTIVPEGIDPVDATMIVTFREVRSAMKRFGMRENESLVIFGAGPVGLSFTKFAKLMGMGTVITLDVTREKMADARAAAETGAPVLVHTENGLCGPEAARFFLTYGVAPQQVIICHLDKMPANESAMTEVMGMGAWVELDTLYRPKYLTNEQVAARILSLVASGHEERMLLGLDTTRARMRSYGGSIGLDALLSDFLPMLRTRGVPISAINAMTVGNPARALAWRT